MSENEQILRKMETKKTFIIKISKRQLNFLGHYEERGLGESATLKA